MTRCRIGQRLADLCPVPALPEQPVQEDHPRPEPSLARGGVGHPAVFRAQHHRRTPCLVRSTSRRTTAIRSSEVPAGPAERPAVVLDGEHVVAVVVRRTTRTRGTARTARRPRSRSPTGVPSHSAQFFWAAASPAACAALHEQGGVPLVVGAREQVVAAAERVEVVVLHGVEAVAGARVGPAPDDPRERVPLGRRADVEQPLPPDRVDHRPAAVLEHQPPVAGRCQNLFCSTWVWKPLT